MIVPKKHLGQNFLRDQKVLKAILRAAELSLNDTVLEIGTGTGILTKKIAKQAGRVITVEKDETLFQLAQQRLKNRSNIFFLKADIRKLEIEKLIEENYKVVGNIPYYLTGRLLRLLLENWPKPQLAVLMLQKEVAEKLIAKNKKQSILSVITHLLGSIELIMYVPKTAFWPIPKVDSAVVKIVPFKSSILDNYPEIKNLLRIGFSSPRKYLLNNLSLGLKVSRTQVEQIFKELGIPSAARAENLKIEHWEKLGKLLQNNLLSISTKTSSFK